MPTRIHCALPRFPQIDVLTGKIDTVAGTQNFYSAVNMGNTDPRVEPLCQPYGIAFDAAGDLYFSDSCTNGRRTLFKMLAI